MKQNTMILSEREIQKLVKQILLKEQSGANRTITDIQNLLIRKGRREVGTSDGKAGLNTLTAINNALSLGLNLYRPQAAKQNTQTNTNTQSTSVVKNPINFNSNAMTTKDNVQQTGDNTTTQGQTSITPNANASDDKGVSFNSVKK